MKIFKSKKLKLIEALQVVPIPLPTIAFKFGGAHIRVEERQEYIQSADNPECYHIEKKWVCYVRGEYPVFRGDKYIGVKWQITSDGASRWDAISAAYSKIEALEKSGIPRPAHIRENQTVTYVDGEGSYIE